ncbi:DNA helicase [Pochonia chlamydosporia 170]|uniref:DNA helicase n=1 Tax=Pochonia chlamydosporia 170 TaxID=1380566 RepID=A0A179F6T7_METCM|nr:DNA helicase [Pochonia chlamydosporia 170]OAQ61174.1 DNA helicase [Pochonia chlamydosporia 170]
MSQSQKTTGNNAQEHVDPEPTTQVMKSLVRNGSAMLVGPNCSIFAGKELGISDIGCFLLARNAKDQSAYLGSTMHFPFGEQNEKKGFGMCHMWSASQGTALPAKTYTITVKFPHTGEVCFIEPADAGTRSRFPDEKRELSLLEVFLNDEAQVVVEGYGLPYANEGHVAEEWLLRGKPIVDNVTLMGILTQREFRFVVASSHDKLSQDYDFGLLPEPFSYPYGTNHSWKKAEVYAATFAENKGHQFAPRTSFDNINEMLTVLSQAEVQDVIWLDEEARKIRATKVPGYFIPVGNRSAEESGLYYVIVALPQDFRATFESAWRRLSRHCRIQVLLGSPAEGSKIESGHWDALIVDGSTSIDALKAHLTQPHELVLKVRRPLPHEKSRGPEFQIKTFDTKRAIEDGVCLFQSTAAPSNPKAFGLTDKLRETNPSAWRSIRDGIEFRMRVHRALMMGMGLYETHRARPASRDKDTERRFRDHSLGVPPTPRSLPNVRLLDVAKREFVNALMQEVLPEDRSRFAKYLSSRPLGLSIITAPPGFGKTTALAVAALAMADTLGKLYLSAPTDVAVDNAAARLDIVGARVTKRLNDKLSESGSPPKYRRKLVVRAYSIDDELRAFKNLIRNPHPGDNTAPESIWSKDSKWTLNLSLAYWTMVILRAPVVRQLGPDDKSALHGIRDWCDKNWTLESLRAVATGNIDWAEYSKGTMATDDAIKGIMRAVFNEADVIATSPALACVPPFRDWRESKVQGIVFDEAANLKRPDLLCVWGNTCLPCLLVGDEKQLPPAVMTRLEQDQEGNFLNRFGADGVISPIHHFKATGWPIYRLHTQFRMAVGQFDLTHSEVYSDIPLRYGPGCTITLPQHEIGRKLEQYLQARFPDLKAAPVGNLRPVFVHCQGSKCFRDQFSSSLRSPDQAKVALELLVDFVESSKVRAEDIVVISPYRANVNTIKRLRQRPEFAALRSMRPASTVSSFQGQESDIVVIVLGTNTFTGSGFTADEARLNVMLSRHKSGLILVGDVDVTGVTKKKQPPKRIVVIGENGEKHFTKANMLRNVHFGLHAAGRVVWVQVQREAEG